MTILNCFLVLVGRKKKNKGEEETKADKFKKAQKTLNITLQQPVKTFETDDLKSTAFGVSMPFGTENSSGCHSKVMSHESPIQREASEVAYEGEDELEVNSIKRNLSNFDLQHQEGNLATELTSETMKLSHSFDTELSYQFDKTVEKDGETERNVDVVQSGHLSDPGTRKAEFWASPNLKWSCSNLETGNVIRKIADHLPPKSQSFEELQEIAERMKKNVNCGSPLSVMTHFSADKVILKKHSSSQVLPSRSRRLWWKLFLWSHRNMHRPLTVKQNIPSAIAAMKQHGGYTSDTLELKGAMQFSNQESPQSFTGDSLNIEKDSHETGKQIGDAFHAGVSNLWPPNQWLAFSTESSTFARVEEWVKHLDTQPSVELNLDDNDVEGIVFPPSPEADRSLVKDTTYQTRCSDVNLSEEILHANNVIQSLNSSSTIAHISGIGLKVIPSISSFLSLRTVNLSSNLIVHITPGSLPKGLHTLNLSRNKISTIEGLRDLTRLRILDLSYNRISRIGHGLSNCQQIKELYLAGNKVSDVEGLHRLLKLTVLDVSFNKLTTMKAVGQLVANYNSLQALNLLGNPIQINIADDQLRKAVCSLLPMLVYLNKQPIKPQRAREILTDSVAKAALGNHGYSSHRKTGKRMGRSGASLASGHKSSASVAHKSRHTHRLKSQMKVTSSAIASSSH